MNDLLRCYALNKNKAVCGLFHKNVHRNMVVQHGSVEEDLLPLMI